MTSSGNGTSHSHKAQQLLFKSTVRLIIQCHACLYHIIAIYVQLNVGQFTFHTHNLVDIIKPDCLLEGIYQQI